MLNFFRVILLLLFGLLSLGSGLCTLGFVPAATTAPGLFMILIPSGLFAVGCFFAARYFYRRLTDNRTEE
jgi:hypothetical protein